MKWTKTCPKNGEIREKKGVPQPQKRRVPEGTHMHIFVRRGVGTPNLQKLRVHHNVSFQYPYPPDGLYKKNEENLKLRNFKYCIPFEMKFNVE